MESEVLSMVGWMLGEIGNCEKLKKGWYGVEKGVEGMVKWDKGEWKGLIGKVESKLCCWCGKGVKKGLV